jgi:hypothetical protein
MTPAADVWNEKMVKRMKNHDRKIAVSIAAFAAIKLKDANGNINTEIWEPYITDPEKQCGNLMNQNSIEVFMKSMLQQQIEKNMPVLMECSNHDTICKWIVTYAGQWEEAYRQPADKSYDISVTVLSVMSEAVAHMSRHFQGRALDERKIRAKFEAVLAGEHDDVIDNDTERRGHPTINQALGNKLAVLTGDVISSRGFHYFTRALPQHLLLDVVKLNELMCSAEIEQARTLGTDLTRETYYRIIEGKTAAFMSICCHLGSSLAGEGLEDKAHHAIALRRFGLEFGLAGLHPGLHRVRPFGEHVRQVDEFGLGVEGFELVGELGEAVDGFFQRGAGLDVVLHAGLGQGVE